MLLHRIDASVPAAFVDGQLTITSNSSVFSHVHFQNHSFFSLLTWRSWRLGGKKCLTVLLP
jgi:hypothetical protein